MVYILLQKDAEERAKRRKANEAKATALREKANPLFKDGKIAEALEIYLEALQLWPDCLPLLTNRALCHVKLEQFEEAKRV